MNFAVTFRILQSYFESCSHVIEDFVKLQSHFESCSHVIEDFVKLQSHFESCSHVIADFKIRRKMLKVAVKFRQKSQSRDCTFF